jgi:hypothetical protein
MGETECRYETVIAVLETGDLGQPSRPVVVWRADK